MKERQVRKRHCSHGSNRGSKRVRFDARRLEIQAQAELEAAGIGGAGDLAEVASGEGGSNAEPGEVVRGVVELGTELHVDLLVDAEILLDGRVPVVGAGAADNVAAEVSEGAKSRQGKGGLVEPLKAGAGVLLPVADDVRALVAEAGAGAVADDAEIEGQAGVEGRDAGELPAAKGFFIPLAAAKPEGQRVDVADDEIVATVKGHEATVALGVVAVHGLLAEAAGVSDGVGPGVGSAQLATAFDLAADLNLERVVNGVGTVDELLNVSVATVGAEGVEVDAGVSLEGAEAELVDVERAGEAGGGGADIGDVEGGEAVHFMLEAEAPIENAGDLEINGVRVGD